MGVQAGVYPRRVSLAQYFTSAKLMRKKIVVRDGNGDRENGVGNGDGRGEYEQRRSRASGRKIRSIMAKRGTTTTTGAGTLRPFVSRRAIKRCVTLRYVMLSETHTSPNLINFTVI